MKARIVKRKIGRRTYFYPQIQKRFIGFIKVWFNLGSVCLSNGSICWWISLGTYNESIKMLKNFEELMDTKLEMTGLDYDGNPSTSLQYKIHKD